MGVYANAMGIVFVIIVVCLIIGGIVMLVLRLKDQQGKRYIQRHPESATIYMLVEDRGGVFFEMRPKSVDGNKPIREVYAEGYGVYLSPGQHSLEIILSRRSSGAIKSESQRVLSMPVLLEAGKSYLLKLDSSAEGVYLVEGYPPDNRSRKNQ